MPGTDEMLILAVDDTPANLVALERVLGAVHARVVRAASGEEALGLCLRHRFALAILDVQMPEMDGYELAEILQSDPGTSTMPIIFMTAAYFDESHVFRGYTSGAVDYIVKPYHPATLLAKVKVFLELADQRRQLEVLLAEKNQALHASEVRFADLFELAPQALLMASVDGHIHRANAAAETLFAYPRDELQRRLLGDLLPDFALESALQTTPDLPQGMPLRSWTALPGNGLKLRVDARVAPAEISGTHCLLVSISDISERVAAYEAVERSLRDKELLLKEVHHRVKNNLQVIGSLLNLQSQQSEASEVRAILQECVGRVRSMAMVHEQLYSSGTLYEIDLGSYTLSLADILRGAYAPRAKVKVDARPLGVTIDIATPLGLLINEVLSNALKHGLMPPIPGRSRRTGDDWDVVVSIDSNETGTRISVTDSGPGLNSAEPVGSPNSIGMELIRGLSRQLGATLTFDSSDGLQVLLTLTRI